MRTLIRDAIVVTVNDAFEVLRPGSVYLDGKRILAVGPTERLLKNCPPADKVLDATGKIALPGLVSIHNHVGFTLFRGRSEEVGHRCVTGMYYPMGTVATRAERRAVGALTYAELLKSGVTTALEMEEDVDIFADFVERVGIRSAMGVMIHDVDVDRMARGEFRYEKRLREAQLRQATEFVEQWHGKASGRIIAMMTPNMTISSSPELLRACRAEAEKRGLRLSMHLGWGPEEVEIIQRIHGKTPFEYARDTGLMAHDTIMAHCLYSTDADAAVLSQSRTSIAHCPLMNSVRGHIAPIQKYMCGGNTVGLGIDNMFADHFDVVRSALIMARVRNDDPLAMLAPEALRLATMGGAKALGLETEIGSLEPGKLADLVLINTRTFGMTPNLDPVANLVYHCHSKDVDTVFVDGEPVVENSKLLRVDSIALIDAAEHAAQTAWARFITKYGSILAARPVLESIGIDVGDINVSS